MGKINDMISYSVNSMKLVNTIWNSTTKLLSLKNLSQMWIKYQPVMRISFIPSCISILISMPRRVIYPFTLEWRSNVFPANLIDVIIGNKRIIIVVKEFGNKQKFIGSY